MGTITWTDQLN